jgi:hypothetical protein
MEQAVLAWHLKELRHSMTVDGAIPIRKKLREIVPEYFELAACAENGRTDRPAVLRHVAGWPQLTLVCCGPFSLSTFTRTFD